MQRTNKNSTCTLKPTSRYTKEQRQRDKVFQDSIMGKKKKDDKKQTIKTINDINSTSPMPPLKTGPAKKRTKKQQRKIDTVNRVNAKYNPGIRPIPTKAPVKTKAKVQKPNKNSNMVINSRPIRVGKGPSGGDWRCKICTFMNKPPSTTCSMCNSEKGAVRQRK